MKINEMIQEIHENAVNHGWWEEDRAFGELIALCHSELSEALEEYRNGKSMVYCEPCTNTGRPFKEHSDKRCMECLKACPTCKPEGMAVELADCVIRIMDMCGRYNIDLESVILQKHAYNKTRPYKHGGKVI